MSEAVLFLMIGLALILFYGDPSLMDAIISKLMATCS